MARPKKQYSKDFIKHIYSEILGGKTIDNACRFFGISKHCFIDRSKQFGIYKKKKSKSFEVNGIMCYVDSGTGYLKTTKRPQELLHRLLWRKQNGSIPVGAVVHHIDGNRLNNEISNLIMIPSIQAHTDTHGGWSKMGKKGGLATGPNKRRGDSAYYRKLAIKSHSKRRKNAGQK